MRRNLAATTIAALTLTASLSAAPAAQAGTTWSSVSTAAVGGTQNGVTWKNVTVPESSGWKRSSAKPRGIVAVPVRHHSTLIRAAISRLIGR